MMRRTKFSLSVEGGQSIPAPGSPSVANGYMQAPPAPNPRGSTPIQPGGGAPATSRVQHEQSIPATDGAAAAPQGGGPTYGAHFRRLSTITGGPAPPPPQVRAPPPPANPNNAMRMTPMEAPTVLSHPARSAPVSQITQSTAPSLPDPSIRHTADGLDQLTNVSQPVAPYVQRRSGAGRGRGAKRQRSSQGSQRRSNRRSGGSEGGDDGAASPRGVDIPLAPNGGPLSYHWYMEKRRRVLVYGGQTYRGAQTHKIWKRIKELEAATGVSGRSPAGGGGRGGAASATTPQSTGRGRGRPRKNSIVQNDVEACEQGRANRSRRSSGEDAPRLNFEAPAAQRRSTVIEMVASPGRLADNPEETKQQQQGKQTRALVDDESISSLESSSLCSTVTNPDSDGSGTDYGSLDGFVVSSNDTDVMREHQRDGRGRTNNDPSCADARHRDVCNTMQNSVVEEDDILPPPPPRSKAAVRSKPQSKPEPVQQATVIELSDSEDSVDAVAVKQVTSSGSPQRHVGRRVMLIDDSSPPLHQPTSRSNPFPVVGSADTGAESYASSLSLFDQSRTLGSTNTPASGALQNIVDSSSAQPAVVPRRRRHALVLSPVVKPKTPGNHADSQAPVTLTVPPPKTQCATTLLNFNSPSSTRGIPRANSNIDPATHLIPPQRGRRNYALVDDEGVLDGELGPQFEVSGGYEFAA